MRLYVFLLLGASSIGLRATAADCNANGIPDSEDVAPPPVGLALRHTQELGGLPGSLDAGDIDGHGDDDLVLFMTNGRRVSVFANVDAGVFELKHEVRLRKNVRTVSFAEVDGDGDVDVLAEAFGSLSLLENLGDGSFGPDRILFSAESRVAPSLADLDGDGDLDGAMVSTRQGGGIAFLRNERAEGFVESSRVPLDAHRRRLVFVNMNQDGALDLFVVSPRSLVYWNDGNGVFSEDRMRRFGGLDILNVGDLDRDGELFLSIEEDDGTPFVWVFDNRGADGFEKIDVVRFPRDFELVDVDADGDLDILRGTRVLSTLLNDGTGRFGREYLLARVDRSPSTNSAAFGDFDGDGKPDLVANSGETLLVLFHAPQSFGDCNRNGVPDTCEGLTLDCDRDGVPDLCALTEGSSPDCNGNDVPDECDIATGHSLDRFENGIPDKCDSDCNRNGIGDQIELAMGTGDCDGDGTLDACELVPALAASVVEIRPKIPVPLGQSPTALTIADLDDDGDIDVATAN